MMPAKREPSLHRITAAHDHDEGNDGNDAEMNGFLRGHRVLAAKYVSGYVTETCFGNIPRADGENSFWTFCVEYLDGAATVAGGMALIKRFTHC